MAENPSAGSRPQTRRDPDRVCWAFGWSGGKTLVESSYQDAKVKSRELKATRKRGRAEPAP